MKLRYKISDGRTVTTRDWEQYRITQTRKNGDILSVKYSKKNGTDISESEISQLLNRNGSSWRKDRSSIFPKWINSNGNTAISYTTSFAIDYSANEPYPELTMAKNTKPISSYSFDLESFLERIDEIEKSYNRELVRQKQRERELEEELEKAAKQIEFVVMCWLIGTAVFFIVTLVLMIVLIRFLLKKTKQIDDLKNEKVALIEAMAKSSKTEPVYDENDHRRWMR